MSTEPQAGTNGQSEVVNMSRGLYPFDAAEVNVPIKLDNGAIVTHVLRKAIMKDHLDREEAMKRISKQVARTEFVGERNEKVANADFYDALILRAEGKATVKTDDVGSENEVVEEFSQERCKGFSYETKSKVVDEAYQASFEVVPEDNSPFAGLFEREGTMRVKHEIGNEFVVFYKLKIPSRSQRVDFGQSVQVKEKFEKRNRRSLITTVNLNKGTKLFTVLFEGAEGGMVDGQAYTPEMKKQFLENIDPMFQYLAIDCAVGSFEQARD